ncbi:hypothetical protein FRX31_011019, partial [Thalictrum thalictroides]
MEKRKRGRDVSSSRRGIMNMLNMLMNNPIHRMQKFDSLVTSNVDMDIETKRAALIVSESV